MSYPSRVFEHPNMTDFECPVCHTSKDAPVVLVPIPGTEHDNIVQCKQVHQKCYDLLVEMQSEEVIKPTPEELGETPLFQGE